MAEFESQDSASARQLCQRLIMPDSMLKPVSQLCGLVMDEGVGLGEVLQDSARQAKRELEALIGASARIAENAGQRGDYEIIENIHYTLKTVKSVLETTPAAMGRNKSETLGEKERLSAADILLISKTFLSTLDIVQLLAAENSGHVLALSMDDHLVKSSALEGLKDGIA